MASTAALKERLEAARARGLALDMTRGKPSPEQLELSRGLLEAVDSDEYRAEDGTDCRNYGGALGLPEMRRLYGEFFGVPQEQVVIGGTASLELMHDLITQALLTSVPGSSGPWRHTRNDPVRFLCPVPGYDRHFTILERYGIEMISVPLDEHGPDLDQVTQRVAEDERIKGMFCVPRYSNPTGITYSDGVVETLASMPVKASDFRIFWDDAYSVHNFDGPRAQLLNILKACDEAGHPDRAFVFGSTSKISHAGAGVAAMASSATNIEYVAKARSVQIIGPDKLNQLRHARFFKDLAGIQSHMEKHAALLRPRFETVLQVLEESLGGQGVAQWTRPTGGYFISVDLAPGMARKVVGMAGELGVKLTPAGATFPHGHDPEDRNIRLAPSFPSVVDLKTATEVFCDCVLLAAKA